MLARLKWYDIQVTIRLNPLNWYWKPRFMRGGYGHHVDLLMLSLTMLHA